MKRATEWMVWCYIGLLFSRGVVGSDPCICSRPHSTETNHRLRHNVCEELPWREYRPGTIPRYVHDHWLKSGPPGLSAMVLTLGGASDGRGITTRGKHCHKAQTHPRKMAFKSIAALACLGCSPEAYTVIKGRYVGRVKRYSSLNGYYFLIDDSEFYN